MYNEKKRSDTGIVAAIGRNGKKAATAGSIRNIAATAGAILLFTMIGFKAAPDTNRAEVNSVQGLLIFTDSRPVAEYSYLGTVKGPGPYGLDDPQYTNVRDVLIKRAKKQFPEANGIILQLNSGGEDKADAIKMKP